MAVTETKKGADSLKQAATILENFDLGSSYRLPSILLSLDKLAIFSFPNNSFYENHVLCDLKNDARLKAWTLVGIVDVHGYLKPN